MKPILMYISEQTHQVFFLMKYSRLLKQPIRSTVHNFGPESAVKVLSRRQHTRLFCLQSLQSTHIVENYIHKIAENVSRNCPYSNLEHAFSLLTLYSQINY